MAWWRRPFGDALGLRRDWLFLVILAVATVIRIMAMVAFRPGLELYGDSYDYVRNAFHLRQGEFHPIGYAVFLRLLSPMRFTVAVVAVQHVLGVALGVVTYAGVRRLTARPWLAAVAAAPVLLDGYQVDVEQFLLSDTLFLVLVGFACLLILVREKPPTWAFALAGLLVAAATVTRGLGLAVLLPLIAYSAVTRLGWRRVLVLAACALVPSAAYVVRYHQTHREWALESTDGTWLYGRTAYFADCAQLPASVRDICPREPVARRAAPVQLTWSKHSPLRRKYPPAERDQAGKRFGYAVIRAEPLPYLRTVVDHLAHDVAPVRTHERITWPARVWQMRAALTPRATNTTFASSTLSASRHADKPFPEAARAHPPAAALEGYQKVVYTWGPLLVLGLIAAAAAVVWRRSRGRVAWVGAALAAGGVLLLVVPAMTQVQDYRYVLPAQALLWPGGMLGLAALLDARRRDPLTTA